MNGKILGQKIQTARENQGWTQTVLAHRANVSQAVVAGYEKGQKVRPDKDIVNQIAAALNVSSDFLLAEDDKLQHIPPNIMAWIESKDSLHYLKQAYKSAQE